ncbi:hypothetical protein [Streptomyces nigra]|uniref:hypothetical protein n=1 Tax=Streptomyces nigra TaxID=1827580 RepID=UPI00343CD4BF
MATSQAIGISRSPGCRVSGAVSALLAVVPVLVVPVLVVIVFVEVVVLVVTVVVVVIVR